SEASRAALVSPGQPCPGKSARIAFRRVPDHTAKIPRVPISTSSIRVLVTGRRHSFALPSAKQLGFDLWLISSNGAVTRSLSGETFHRDLMPAETCRQLCHAMQEFRGNTVLTFDQETKGAIVLERLDEIGASIRRWIEKNMEFIEFVVPIERALVSDPVQSMFCGTMQRMALALQALDRVGLEGKITVLRT